MTAQDAGSSDILQLFDMVSPENLLPAGSTSSERELSPASAPSTVPLEYESSTSLMEADSVSDDDSEYFLPSSQTQRGVIRKSLPDDTACQPSLKRQRAFKFVSIFYFIGILEISPWVIYMYLFGKVL